MNIICPQCGFNREVAPERIPGGAVIATCPKCGCRFRFSAKTGTGSIIPAIGNLKESANDTSEDNIRAIANQAYEREAHRLDGETATDASNPGGINSGDSDVPWAAAPGAIGWFSAFYQTVLRVMFSAPAFFRGLSPAAPAFRPLSFYLVICVLQTIVERIWGQMFYAVLSPGAGNDPQLAQLLSLLAPDQNLPLSLVIRCGLLVIQLYIFTFLLVFAYRLIAPGKGTFNLIFQIMSYSSAPSILCLVPAIGSLAGAIWGIGCLLIGCKSAMGLSWGQTLAGILPLFFICAPIIVQILRLLPK